MALLTETGDAPIHVRRALLIVNPASRRGKRLHERALAECRAAGVACDVILTERAGHAAELARALVHAPEGKVPEVRRYDAVFTLGGDGTAMEVVGALSPNGPPVGILPGGTGNLLARALGISLNVRRAVRQLVHGTVIRIDLGRLDDGRRFAIGVGVGIDAAMIAETPAHWKRRFGVLAYIIIAARAVLRQDRFQVTVTANGEQLTRTAAAVLVANFGGLLHNIITLGEQISPYDGVLNVCIFDPERFVDAVRVMRKLVFRDFRPDPAMSYLAGQYITVETTPPRIAQADGEVLEPTPFSVVTEPRAGCIIIPHRQISRQ